MNRHGFMHFDPSPEKISVKPKVANECAYFEVSFCVQIRFISSEVQTLIDLNHIIFY